MESSQLNENQDSIKISKTSRGYSWEIKLYYDIQRTKPEEVITRLGEIDNALKLKFKEV